MDHKKILLLSLSPVTSDPRVIRQMETLLKEGWDLTLAGFRGNGTPDPQWQFIELPYLRRFSYAPEVRQATGFWGRMKRWWARLKDTVRLDQTLQCFPFLAEWCCWRQPIYQSLLQTFKGKTYAHILSHDYDSLPLAFKLLAEGGKVMVDVHEHALTENQTDFFWTNLRWRFWKRPHVHALQKKYFPRVYGMATVCDGIAQSLEATYPQAPKPVVVRNVPFYTPQPFREVDPSCLKVLYHGSIGPRGVRELIQVAALCLRPLRVTIRGSGDARYITFLKELAEKLRVGHKIVWEPPVPFAEIVPAANAHDIGFYVPPGYSLENQFSLPNKFFEYITAGLALCVAHLPEMAKIVKPYSLGLLVSREPQKIAAMLDTWALKDVEQAKKNSLKVAKELCWEKESKRFSVLLRQGPEGKS